MVDADRPGQLSFNKLVEKTPVTIDEWWRQKEIRDHQDLCDPLGLGFATFFLNRTNRSGIIKGAGVIGGFDQEGRYKIDCRFNRTNLIQRIRHVSRYRAQIHLYNADASDFMSSQLTNLPKKAFVCIDPPYFSKGSALYESYYGEVEHQQVSQQILSLSHPWIVTYDNEETIKRFYASRRQFTFDVKYSLQSKRIGTELLIASKGLRIPADIRERRL